MPRIDSLKKLEAQLLKRKSELLRTYMADFKDLQHERDGDVSGDDADAANISVSTELLSQLAERESRELRQIEHALRRHRQGVYGVCELCGKNIPLARLQALPYTTLCIDCQRQVEKDPELAGRHEANLSRVYDAGSDTDGVGTAS